MCQAFSCVITKEGSVYWKAGVDSHEDIIDLFKKKDKLLTDNKLPADFCRVEIIPENYDYLNKDGKWIFRLDDKPDWWNIQYEKLCWNALSIWKKRIYSSFNYLEAKNPVHPFNIEPPKITEEILELLKIWDSVGDSVGDSVWTSVWDSVWDSVRDSVWDSVWDSVRDSVGDSIWDSVRDSIEDKNLIEDSVGASIEDSARAYIGSMFPKIKKWKYVDYKKEPFKSIKGYPFQSAVDLWKMGLVSSFDGTTWRLHSKNGIEWEDKNHEIR